MSDPSVSERRIRPIQDAVATGNWKQALKECEKWQKKGEKSDKFLALKAFVLVNQPDPSGAERGLTETLQLCHRTPAVTDVDAIHILQNSLKDLSLQDTEAPKLWDRAAAARPNDHGLLMTWLDKCIADTDWRGAQKAAMALRKAFPQDRQYEYWNILMYFLVSRDTSIAEKERNLFGNLAYRLMSKAAEAIPSGSERPSNSARTISTPEEVCLLVHIYRDTGHASEAVDLLLGLAQDSQNAITKQDPQLVTALLLDTLELAERWTDAFDACNRLIEMPEYRADDRVWRLLARAGAASHLDKDYMSMLTYHTTKRELRDRPAQLTKLKQLRDKDQEGSMSHADVLILCTQYYRNYQEKSFCFDDLRESLEVLDTEHRKDFRTFLNEQISSKPTMWKRLFKLKFDILTASDEDDSSSVLSRVRSAMQLYQFSISSEQACPEASLIAAADLLYLATMSQKESRTELILRAILILEVSRSKLEDYYPYSVLLIQCYVSMGLMSLAIQTFTKLSIKNLQWENVAHILLKRISSLHPQAYPKDQSSSPRDLELEDGVFTPVGGLDAGLRVLEKSTDSLNHAIREGLKHGSYSNILDSVEVKSNLRRSLNKQIYALEARKISRLLGEDDHMTEGVMRSKDPVDTRDHSFIPAYHTPSYHATKHKSNIYSLIRAGPKAAVPWVDAMAMVDYIIICLENDDPTKDAEDLHLSEFVMLAGPPDRIREGVTVSEYRPYEISMMTQGVVQACKQGTFGDKERGLLRMMEANLSALVHQSESRLESSEAADVEGSVEGSVVKAGDVGVPGWEYLHASFTQMEMVLVVQVFVAWFDRQMKRRSKKQAERGVGGLKKEDMEGLRRKAVEAYDCTKESARSVKRRLGEGGVLGKLMDVALGRDEAGWEGWREDLEKMCGEGGEVEVETRCGRWMESWEDAVDGVVSVNLKLKGSIGGKK